MPIFLRIIAIFVIGMGGVILGACIVKSTLLAWSIGVFTAVLIMFLMEGS